MTIRTANFVRSYEGKALCNGNTFFHALEFYALSAEERSLRVLECAPSNRTRALKRLRRLFMEYLVAQDPAQYPEPLVWRPLMQSLSLLGQPSSDGGLRPIPLPDELKKGRAAICRDLKMHLAIAEPDALGEDHLRARIGYEWARQFTIEFKRPTNGHELFVLASAIDDSE